MQKEKEMMEESDVTIKHEKEGILDNCVRMDEISYVYRKVKILDHVSVTFCPKDFCVIFGEQGAGKTVLFRILLGFLPSYKGSIRFWGQEKKRRDKFLRAAIRYVPEEIAWEYGMKVSDYFRMAQSRSLEYDLQLQEKMCEYFQIDIRVKMLEMSYQQNKLVQILAAVCAGPRILILEEPIRYMNADVFGTVMRLLRVWAWTGHTVLVSTRDYARVSEYGNCYVYLKQGRVIAQGRIHHPDFRHKIVYVRGGNLKYIDTQMDRCIGEKQHYKIYLYKQNMQHLADILKKSGCKDYAIKPLTMEEELEEDLLYPKKEQKDDLVDET